MAIITKDELKAKCEPRTAILPLPELGEGTEIKIRGFTLKDVLEIEEGSSFVGPDGKKHRNEQNDSLLTLMHAIVDPPMTLEDTEWLLNLPYGIAAKISTRAQELGFRTESTFEEAKRMLTANPYLRQLYSVCVNKLGRLPSELADMPESEFNMALAALDLNAEDEEKAIRDST